MGNPVTYLFDGESGIEQIVCTDAVLSYPLHNHVSVYTAGLVLGGSILFSSGGVSRRLGRGNAYLVRPYTPHSIQSEGECSLFTLCIPRNRIDLPAEKRLPVFSPDIARLAERMERFPEMCGDVEQMARFAYMSKYHFIRRFKQEVGLTPHQFLLQNRIRKSQRLLRLEEELPGIALMNGFYDQSHFIRHFKRIVGMPPSAYKDSCIYI